MTRPVPTRRRFLQGVGIAAAQWSLMPPALAKVQAAAGALGRQSPDETAEDEDFWRTVQDAYEVDRGFLNLNNGGVGPFPRQVRELLFRNTLFANQVPAHHLWRVLEPQKETVRRQLADIFGASREEIAICRNATEALETVTFGLDIEAGDEILISDQDYPRMITAWQQRERRDGVVLRTVTLPPPTAGTAEVVAAFAAAITPRTRVLHCCHMLHMTGRVLPVRELCQLARQHGLYSLIDGAHAFAHVEFQRDDLDCDFYGASLHKWFSGPVGTGLLYVRRALIAKVWPLFGADPDQDEDIRKFEEIGTHPCPVFLALAEAAHFHQALGSARKAARLRFLREYWIRALEDDARFRFHTPRDAARSGGIANVEIEGLTPREVARRLLKTDRILVTAFTHDSFAGIRVSPHVYTTRAELDRFVTAVKRIADSPPSPNPDTNESR